MFKNLTTGYYFTSNSVQFKVSNFSFSSGQVFKFLFSLTSNSTAVESILLQFYFKFDFKLMKLTLC